MAVTRYTFTGTLLAEGALHIGSGGGGRVGADDSLTDATVIRDSQGRAYVPGSSLRGVLRAAVGQIAPSLPGIAGEGEIREDAEIDTVVAAALKADRRGADSLEAELQRTLERSLRSAERLFGTVHWASPLLIPDLPLHDADSEARGEIRHGVGIDRDTGAARDAIKYDFEVLPRATAFDFWMRCDLPDDEERHRTIWPWLIALCLRLLEQGELSLGGRVARGVGQVRLVDLKVHRLTLGGRGLLGALLAAPDSPARYGEELPGWVDQRLKELQDVRTTP
jgi:CRISPR-associated RAMP protein (TIGR02581 family)